MYLRKEGYYFIATYRGRDYLGYSFYEAIARALNA